MHITIAGMGYVGLSLAVLLSQTEEVIAYDIDKERLDKIRKKISPIKDEYISYYLKEKPLNIHCTDKEDAFYNADFIIIAVPTDYDEATGKFNTSAIETVINKAIKINSEAVFVIKSTIPVGYTKMLQKLFKTKRILFSPEFLRESKALYDNLYPSRIIVSFNEENKTAAKEFSMLLKKNAIDENVPVLLTGEEEAESIKLFSNTYLAMRVAYFNELDTYAESKNLNTEDIIKGVCLDPRISSHYNNPSFGYGGYCLPKDTKQLAHNFSTVPESLITSIVKSNQIRIQYIADTIYQKAKEKKENPVIGIFRLTMKTNSDNFRNSSIHGVIEELKKKDVQFIVYEPLWKENSYEGLSVCPDFEEFIKVSDIIVANRFEKQLNQVKDKVYTRDLFYEN